MTATARRPRGPAPRSSSGATSKWLAALAALAAMAAMAAMAGSLLLLAVPAPVTGCRGSACCLSSGVHDAAATERLLVVDTDAGADDAMALLALLGAEQEAEEHDAAGEPRMRVVAVTCVHGNADVHNVSRNVLATLRAVRRLDVPVFRGAAQSLLVTPPTDRFYGDDGFGDFLPAGLGGGTVQAEHAAVALARMAARYPGRISLVCLGPLTNVALASRLDPSFLANLQDVFILGGSSTGVGNTKAATEFNVYMDAEAFEAVLRSAPRPVYLMPWETVTAANISADWRTDTLGALGTPQVELLNKAERLTLQGRARRRYAPADAMLALFVLRPDLVSDRTTTTVQVVLGDGFARAATLVDYVGRSGKSPNAVLLQRADRALTECLLLELLSAAVAVPAPAPAVADKARPRSSA